MYIIFYSIDTNLNSTIEPTIDSAIDSISINPTADPTRDPTVGPIESQPIMLSRKQEKWKSLQPIPSILKYPTNCQIRVAFNEFNKRLVVIHDRLGLLNYSFNKNI